jgi:mannose-1-phosphate guanylyltransferase
VLEHLPELKESQILLEPSAKNTAPCLTFASFRINAIDPDANCIVAPSDHIILDEHSFNENLSKAINFVGKTSALVTLGIKPSRPDTGYGYIQYLKENNGDDIHKVKLFTEKPNEEIAKQFIDSGDFLWNAGIFVWNNRTIMAAIKNLLPNMHDLFMKGEEDFGKATEQKFINDIYPQCTNTSIDYGIMEKADNVFVTRIKTNTVYETIEELELPDNIDQNILKDEIIRLTSDKAKKTGISEHKLRLVHVYKEDENKVIIIITNQLEWEYNTIAELYKKRWDIELFFKALKQNLQVKTFWGTSENAVKSQIFVALINYLLLELIKRTISKKSVAFSNLSEKIRFCLYHYLSLDYVCNEVREGVRKVTIVTQKEISFEKDLFSG